MSEERKEQERERDGHFHSIFHVKFRANLTWLDPSVFDQSVLLGCAVVSDRRQTIPLLFERKERCGNRHQKVRRKRRTGKTSLNRRAYLPFDHRDIDVYFFESRCLRMSLLGPIQQN